MALPTSTYGGGINNIRGNRTFGKKPKVTDITKKYKDINKYKATQEKETEQDLDRDSTMAANTSTLTEEQRKQNTLIADTIEDEVYEEAGKMQSESARSNTYDGFWDDELENPENKTQPKQETPEPETPTPGDRVEAGLTRAAQAARRSGKKLANKIGKGLRTAGETAGTELGHLTGSIWDSTLGAKDAQARAYEDIASKNYIPLEFKYEGGIAQFSDDVMKDIRGADKLPTHNKTVVAELAAEAAKIAYESNIEAAKDPENRKSYEAQAQRKIAQLAKQNAHIMEGNATLFGQVGSDMKSQFGTMGKNLMMLPLKPVLYVASAISFSRVGKNIGAKADEALGGGFMGSMLGKIGGFFLGPAAMSAAMNTDIKGKLSSLLGIDNSPEAQLTKVLNKAAGYGAKAYKEQKGVLYSTPEVDVDEPEKDKKKTGGSKETGKDKNNSTSNKGGSSDSKSHDSQGTHYANNPELAQAMDDLRFVHSLSAMFDPQDPVQNSIKSMTRYLVGEVNRLKGETEEQEPEKLTKDQAIDKLDELSGRRKKIADQATKVKNVIQAQQALEQDPNITQDLSGSTAERKDEPTSQKPKPLTLEQKIAAAEQKTAEAAAELDKLRPEDSKGVVTRSWQGIHKEALQEELSLRQEQNTAILQEVQNTLANSHFTPDEHNYRTAQVEAVIAEHQAKFQKAAQELGDNFGKGQKNELLKDMNTALKGKLSELKARAAKVECIDGAENVGTNTHIGSSSPGVNADFMKQQKQNTINAPA